MLRVFDHDPAAQPCSRSCCRSRASTTSSCATSHRRGLPVPAELLDRDGTLAHTFTPELVPTSSPTSTSTPHEHWDAVRGVRGAGRPRGQLPALALPAPQDGRAHHRLQARHRRLERRRLPAPRARADLLPRAVRRAHRDRHAGTLSAGHPALGCAAECLLGSGRAAVGDRNARSDRAGQLSAARAGRPHTGARSRPARRGRPRCPAAAARGRPGGRRSGRAGTRAAPPRRAARRTGR